MATEHPSTLTPLSFKPVFYSFLVQQKSWARAWLNGLPLYRTPGLGPDSRSGTVNHLLVPGKNAFRVEVLKTRPAQNAPEMPDAVKLEFYEVLNPNAREQEKLDRRVLASAAWPQMKDALEPRHRRLPLSYAADLDVDVPVAVPPWLDAPPQSFGCAGTLELQRAVTEVVQTFEEERATAFLDVIALKLEHYAAAHPGVEAVSVKAALRTFQDEFFAYRPRVRPLDFAELHFEPLCDGRVAHVTRNDGGYAIEAVCEADTKRRVEADLLLTMRQGRWRVFA